MKNKVKPSPKGVITPFISQTKNERGITLVALIITIIILIILAAVTLRAVIGGDIIQVATDGVRKLCKRAKK